jgi:hypothetical protein
MGQHVARHAWHLNMVRVVPANAGCSQMKLTVLYIVVVGAILIRWLTAKPKRQV